jgi:hypothetical protein
MKKLFLSIVLILLMVLLPVWAGAATYYVDQSIGSDAYSGTNTSFVAGTLENDGSTATDTKTRSTNALYWHKITTTAGGTLRTYKAYFGAGYTGKVKFALYVNSSNLPGALVANTQSAEITNPVSGWNTANVTGGATLSASSTYWIGVWYSGATSTGPGCASGGTDQRYIALTYGTWPDPASGTSAGGATSSSVYMQVGDFDQGPWLTIAKVNASTFAVNDQILFKRGGTWAESLVPPTAGTSGNPIIFSSYGDTALDAHIAGTGGGFGLSITKDYTTYNNLRITRATVAGSCNNVIFNYCKFIESSVHGIVVNSNITINNSLFINNLGGGVYNQGATPHVLNSIFIGNGDQSEAAIRSTSSTVHIQNNLITGNNYQSNGNYIAAYVTDDGGNLVQATPYMMAYKHEHFMTISLDDLDIDFAEQVAAALNPLGVYYTGFINPGTVDGTTLRWTALRTAGNEIQLHSRGHNKLITTVPFTVAAGSNANPTININQSTKTATLTTTTNTPNNNCSVDWSVTEKNIGHLITACNSKGWTVAYGDGINAFILEYATATAGDVTTFPYSATTDNTGNRWWQYEILDAVPMVTTLTGVAPTTIGYPMGDTSAALEAYVQANGFVGARGGYGTAGSDKQYYLSSLNIYALQAQNPTGYGIGSDAIIQASARGSLEYARANGAFYIYVSHNPSLASGLTVAQWTTLANAVLASGGIFTTFNAAIASIRASHTTADNLIYTKTYTDNSNYRLQSTSPAINAGVDVGLTTDYQGRSIVGLPDIGACEFTSSVLRGIPSNKPGIVGGEFITYDNRGRSFGRMNIR